MNELAWLVGHRFQSLTRREYDWVVAFDRVQVSSLNVCGASSNLVEYGSPAKMTDIGLVFRRPWKQPPKSTAALRGQPWKAWNCDRASST